MKLEENIARMEQELADMKKQLEQEDKLELKGGDGYQIRTTFSPICCNVYASCNVYAKSDVTTRGAFRATRELAEIADRNMVIRNRLEAYAMQIDPEWRAGMYTEVCGISLFNDKYEVFHTIARNIGAVYMSKETAEILCKKLNLEEIEL